MKIVIGSDHAGVEHKKEIINLVEKLGHTPIDIGTSSGESVDYPDYGREGARMVVRGEADMGILFCGTGIGISIAANKVRGARAALCCNPETAKLAREHNSAQILCMGARFTSIVESLKIAEAFINTPAAKDERHLRRIKKIMDIEENQEIKERKACCE